MARLPSKALRAAGRDWARDFRDLCADSDTVQTVAYEIAAAYVPPKQVGAAAEEVYEGMIDVLERDRRRSAQRAARATGGTA